MHRRSLVRGGLGLAVAALVLLPGWATAGSMAPGRTGSPAGIALSANITVVDQAGQWNCAQGYETFAFFSHVSGGIAPYRYAWNFGDGSPSSSAEDPVHTYTTPQSFSVTLMVVDSVNASARTSMTLTWGIPLYCSSPTSNWGGVVLYGALIVGIAGGGLLVLRARRRSPPLPPWP
jgi:hypothetical protein